MGLWTWILERLKANVTYTFKIEQTILEMPREGECVIFKFPPGTPSVIIEQFEDKLVEFQNTERKFISTNLELEYKLIKRKNAEVEHHGPSSEAEGHTPVEEQGQHKK